ncbi:MAG: hypothetical protein MN733_42020, partial [Nitrososphaera sp.]|nr:hypothetical protein [Nitrososphaera sp.]
TFAKARIPVRYSCIPPFRIKIWGTLLFNERKYFFRMTSADMERFRDPKIASELEKKLMEQMPEEARELFATDGMILLPVENFSMFHYKRDCARLWADPLLLPIMDDLRYKKVLRRLDVSVAESIINPITVFKLGDTVNGFAPTREMFLNIAHLLKTPGQSKTLVWSDLLEVEQHVIDAKEVLTMEKYKEVNDSILAGLGISSVLINGGEMSGGSAGGGFAGAYLSVRTLLERLEDGRSEVMRFLESEFEHIKKAMGWTVSPIVMWDQMSLRDEEAAKRIVIDLMDRKVISTETALHSLGFNHDVEMERKKRENKQTDKTGIVQSVGPFEQAVQVNKGEDPATRQQDMNEENLPHEQEMRKKELELKKHDMVMKRKQLKKSDTGPRRGPGKPQGQPQKPMKKNRKTRITASQAMTIYDAISTYFKPIYLQSIGKSSLRELTAPEKEVYDACAYAVLCAIDVEQRITPELVKDTATELATNGVPIDEELNELYQERFEEFEAEQGRSPTVSERKELEVAVYCELYGE